ncbi:MAG: type I methionyl aminopeptidase [bacterium]|nr:type I methionyl aminopeptidase [bacterium]
MIIKSKEELEALREGGKILAKILKEVAAEVKPGIKAKELNRLAESLILKSGGDPAFKGYSSKHDLSPFPAALCVSINEEVVHGIPTDRKIKEGDLVKLDLGFKYRGFFTDTALTLGVGKISREAKNLSMVTKEATDLGISRVKAGVRIGDISSVVQKHLDKNHIGIIRDLAGHGVGLEVHEEPLIPNHGEAGTGSEIKEGMVLAIEVMTTLGSGKIKLAKDGWTYISADGTLGAHFEHTVVVTKKGAEILTI